MRNEREPGATFAPGEIGWVDFETRGQVSISAGTDRYSRFAHAIMLAWAIGDGPCRTEAVVDFSRPLTWSDMPRELVDFHARAARGEAVFCAHNATFDRAIWNNSTFGFPRLRPNMMIDTRAQATAAGLPASLDLAARYSGARIQKDKRGGEWIDLFTKSGEATPESHPEEWALFREYAETDIGAMRELFRGTLQLSRAEWREYWAAEQINDTGVAIDMALVAAAADMATKDRRISADELFDLTYGDVETVDQVARITKWLKSVLPHDGCEILIKKWPRLDKETGAEIAPMENSLSRDRVVRLLAYLDAQEWMTPTLEKAKRVLQIRLYGGSRTPAKFSKMLLHQFDGVIRGQYVFNGAGQTGRMSARGIQVHNLTRDALPYEMDAIDALVAGVTPAALATLGDDTPISRKLSLLIRPSLVAEPGNAYAWGDWSNIEARVTPWLANDPDADERLAVFAAVDADPSIPDIYSRTTATLMGIPVEAVDKKLRQRGKVLELAASFGGGTNALLNMAANYGMHLEEEDAKAAVRRWREENAWAARFWGRHEQERSYGLWGAANRAMEAPGQPFAAGRIVYLYLTGYLGGSLMCRLPSGRYLTYRKIKWDHVEDIDEDTGEMRGWRQELRFSRDAGRVKLWPGMFCENVTQAVAADILRGTLVRLCRDKLAKWMPVRLHTHDEILVETKEKDVHLAAEILREEMMRGFDWTDGLPIAAETTVGRFYTKNESSTGL